MPEDKIASALQKCYYQNHSSAGIIEAYRKAYYCCYSNDQIAYDYCNNINFFLEQIHLGEQTRFFDLGEPIDEIRSTVETTDSRKFYFLFIVSKKFLPNFKEINGMDAAILECVVLFDTENDLSESDIEKLSFARIWKVLKTDVEVSIMLLNHAVYNEKILSFLFQGYNYNTYIIKSSTYNIVYKKTCERVLSYISFHLNEVKYNDEEISRKLSIEKHVNNIMESMSLQSIYPITGYSSIVEIINASTEKSLLDRIALALHCQISLDTVTKVENILQVLYGKDGDISIPESSLRKLQDDSMEPSFYSIFDQYIRSVRLLDIESLRSLFPLQYLCNGLINCLQRKKRDTKELIDKVEENLNEIKQKEFKCLSPLSIKSVINGLDEYFEAYKKMIGFSLTENFLNVCIKMLEVNKSTYIEEVDKLSQFQNQIKHLGLKHTWEEDLDGNVDVYVSRGNEAYDEDSIIRTIENSGFDDVYKDSDIEEAAEQIICVNTDSANTDDFPALCLFYNNKNLNVNIDNIEHKTKPKYFELIPVSYLSASVIKVLRIYTCK